MIEKIIRSPLSMLFFVFLFGGLVYVLYYEPETLKPYSNGITIGMLIILAIYFSLIIYHNKKHPERKISFFGWLPYEFKEEDEGRQWVTFQACRKVYIFYSIAIPLSIVLIVIFDSIPALPVILLLVMAIMQYGIFWWEERKYT